jgi:hypothetical protein
LNDIAFHPLLPLVAVATEHKIMLFDRATGDPLKGRLAEQHLKDRRRCIFSADGRSIVVDCETKNARRLICVPLKLTPAEEATLKAAAAQKRVEPAPARLASPADNGNRI